MLVFAAVLGALVSIIGWRRFRSRERIKKNAYVLLLERTRFEIPTYLCVEHWLANKGEAKAADEVHYAMRRRELESCRLKGDSPQNALPWHERIGKWCYMFFSGSGTRVMWLIQLHALLFVFSWLFVFSNPASVERPATFVVDGAPVGVGTEQLKGSYEWRNHNGTPPGIPWAKEEVVELRDLLQARGLPGGEVWDQSDAFWVSLNVQIPILHIWARDEWEPASRRCYFGNRVLAIPLLGMQYETFAGIVQIFSYLTIPMIIACVGRSVRRREPT